MSRYLSCRAWVFAYMFASSLAPSAAASTLTSAALEVALPTPHAPPEAGVDMANQVSARSAAGSRRLTANEMTVSTVSELTTALNDATIDHIRLDPGSYTLSAELEITRSVKIEAEDAVSVGLDACASSLVLNINPTDATMTIELIGINITRGYHGVSAPSYASLYLPFCVCVHGHGSDAERRALTE